MEILQLDAVTKQYIEEVIDGQDCVEKILFKLGLFTIYDDLQRIVNRGRLRWMKQYLKGRELVQLWNSCNKNAEAVMCEIDARRRRQDEQENIDTTIRELASCLSNDETPIKQALLELGTVLESKQDLLLVLEMVKEVGILGHMRESLRKHHPNRFICLLVKAQKERSERKQLYEYAKLCSNSITSNNKVKEYSLINIKALIREKISCLDVHRRALVLLALIKVNWSGPLRRHVENMYQREFIWKEFLPNERTPFSLCCYILLCSSKNIDSAIRLMKIHNQRC